MVRLHKENGEFIDFTFKYYGDCMTLIKFQDGIYLIPVIGNPIKIVNIEVIK